MYTLYYSLSSEFLKQKRTSTYWFIIFAPLSMALLYFFVFNRAGSDLIGEGNGWDIMLGHSFSPINNLMMPLFVSVMTSLIHFTDHKNHTWKHIYALPVNKGAVFLGKSLFSLLMLCAVVLVYPFLVVVAGYIASFTEPSLSIVRDQPIHLWGNGIEIGLKTISASLAIWAVHNWLGYRAKSFAMPVGIGLIGTVTHLVMGFGKFENRKFFPYSFTATSNEPFDANLFYESPLVLGVSIGVVVFAISYFDAVRRDIE